MPFLLGLPPLFLSVLTVFAPLFSPRVWRHAQVLAVGAMLAPGKRTVTSCLRILGLNSEQHFVNYHRVLSRARWSGRVASRLLLALLVRRFVPDGPILFGIDDTLERRRGKKIRAKGIYRDPVRSSDAHFVKASGLRSREPDAVGSDPVGRPELGLALSDLFGTHRTLCPATRQVPQASADLGTPDAVASPARAA